MPEIYTRTADELVDPDANDVPGWRQRGNLPTVLSSLGGHNGWTPILSVSIFRDNPQELGGIQTLTAIRGESSTHKDVVSTLTSTFPAETLPLLVKKRRPFVIDGYPSVRIGDNGPNPLEGATLVRYWPQLEGVPDTSSLLPYYCHDVMSRKLNRPDLVSMRSDDELGTVSLARMSLGVSYVGDNEQGEPLYERLLTVGLAFMLHPHQSHQFDIDIHERMSSLPVQERRYRSLGWTSIELFPEAVRTKNVINLAPYVPEHESILFCARGRCLAMTSELISDDPELLLRHLGRSALDPLDITGYNVGNPRVLTD
jgi:hypothetical protein